MRHLDTHTVGGMDPRDVLLDLTAYAIVMMRAEAGGEKPDPRAVQEWASAFHNVPTRMKQVLRDGDDLQAVLDDLWAKNEHLPRVRRGIESWLETEGIELREIFRTAREDDR